MTEIRCIWASRGVRDAAAAGAASVRAVGVGNDIADFAESWAMAWDNSPADPRDAARRAVRGMFVGKRGESEALIVIADAMADAALSALGLPDA